MEKYINPLIDLLNEMTPYLLFGLLVAGILHEFVPRRIYADKLSGNNLRSILWAAVLGIPLPLCSCGVIPTSASIRNEGASKGATVSFLIATPQTGIDSILATASLLGIPFAILRPLVALVTAIAGGCAVNRWCRDEGDRIVTPHTAEAKKGFWKRCLGALEYGFIGMLQDIGKWIVIGLVIAAIITIAVPDNFFAQFNGNPIINMVVILALSIPMYLCATGSIPIAAALMLKGLSPGAALVLLMAGPATNMAAILVVNKVLGRKTLAIYLLTIIIGAITFGLAVDYLLPAEWFSIDGSGSYCSHCATAGTPWWQIASSILFIILLAVAFILRFRKHGHDCSCGGKCECHDGLCSIEKRYRIDGMMCNHCKANVEKNLANIEGVTAVRVELSEGAAYVTGDVAPERIIEAINSIGYKYVDDIK